MFWNSWELVIAGFYTRVLDLWSSPSAGWFPFVPRDTPWGSEHTLVSGRHADRSKCPLGERPGEQTAIGRVRPCGWFHWTGRFREKSGGAAEGFSLILSFPRRPPHTQTHRGTHTYAGAHTHKHTQVHKRTQAHTCKHAGARTFTHTYCITSWDPAGWKNMFYWKYLLN